MKMWVASAPNAVRKSRSGLNSPARVKSACERSQTKNKVLPGFYSHRITMLPRSDLVLKSGLLGMVTGSNSNDEGRTSFRMSR